MNDKDKFSLTPANRSRRTPATPAPVTTESPIAPDGLVPPEGRGTFPRFGSRPNLPPEAISGMFRCGEIILNARARCAEIQAMTEQKVRELDKEIEKCIVETDNKIRLLDEEGKQKDRNLERLMMFEAVLDERHYSDAVRIALIDAFRDSLK